MTLHICDAAQKYNILQSARLVHHIFFLASLLTLFILRCQTTVVCHRGEIDFMVLRLRQFPMLSAHFSYNNFSNVKLINIFTSLVELVCMYHLNILQSNFHRSLLPSNGSRRGGTLIYLADCTNHFPQMQKPVRVHEDSGEGEGVLPQRGHPLHHHPARVCGAAARRRGCMWMTFYV